MAIVPDAVVAASVWLSVRICLAWISFWIQKLGPIDLKGSTPGNRQVHCRRRARDCSQVLQARKPFHPHFFDRIEW